MSYLGRKPIKIPIDTNVEISDNHISVQGPLSTLKRSVHEQVDLIINDTDIVVNEPKNKKIL